MIENWGGCRGWRYGEVAASRGKQGQCLRFSRGKHPMTVVDPGQLLRSGRRSVSRRAHGVHVAPDTRCTAECDGTTHRHLTKDGKLLLETACTANPPRIAAIPRIADHYRFVAPGDITLRRIRQRTACINIIRTEEAVFLGANQARPGQFTSAQYLRDEVAGLRRGRRTTKQSFDGTANSKPTGQHATGVGLCMTREKNPMPYGGGGRSSMAVNVNSPGSAASQIVDPDGSASPASATRPRGAHRFNSPHGVAGDSRGDIYVGEVRPHCEKTKERRSRRTGHRASKNWFD